MYLYLILTIKIICKMVVQCVVLPPRSIMVPCSVLISGYYLCGVYVYVLLGFVFSGFFHFSQTSQNMQVDGLATLMLHLTYLGSGMSVQ